MKRAIMDMGPYTLDLTVKDDIDLDDTFEAICNDTGEKLRVNGWLVENIEWMED